MAERVRVREIDDDEGQRLLRIVRRSSGSVVTWRRAEALKVDAVTSGDLALQLTEVAERVTFLR